jgi:hypothetical protein
MDTNIGVRRLALLHQDAHGSLLGPQDIILYYIVLYYILLYHIILI